MFYTDGSLIDVSTGFGIFNNNLTVSYKLDNPASVYVGISYISKTAGQSMISFPSLKLSILIKIQKFKVCFLWLIKIGATALAVSYPTRK